MATSGALFFCHDMFSFLSLAWKTFNLAILQHNINQSFSIALQPIASRIIVAYSHQASDNIMAGCITNRKRGALLGGMKRRQERWDDVFGRPEPQVDDKNFSEWDTSTWPHGREDIELYAPTSS